MALFLPADSSCPRQLCSIFQHICLSVGETGSLLSLDRFVCCETYRSPLTVASPASPTGSRGPPELRHRWQCRTASGASPSPIHSCHLPDDSSGNPRRLAATLRRRPRRLPRRRITRLTAIDIGPATHRFPELALPSVFASSRLGSWQRCWLRLHGSCLATAGTQTTASGGTRHVRRPPAGCAVRTFSDRAGPLPLMSQWLIIGEGDCGFLEDERGITSEFGGLWGAVPTAPRPKRQRRRTLQRAT